MKVKSLIPFEIALTIADTAVLTQTARHLKNIEVAVLKGTLQGQKYDQIAQDCCYAPEYIKHDVGPKLWQLLSLSLGEKVSKTNLMAVLAQRAIRSEAGVRYPEWQQQKLASGSQDPKPLPKREKNPQSSSIPVCSMIEDLQSLEPPRGVLPLDSPLYIERPAVEVQCYEAVKRSGALIRIQGASQMGKTSLMLRILAHAKQHRADFTAAKNVHTAALKLKRAERAIFTDSDRFLRWFCAALTRKLQLPHQVDQYWNNTCTAQDNCTSYFEHYILSEINGVLILALDQVDQVFLYPKIADQFLTLLQSWDEKATDGKKGNSLWENLRLIRVHTTEVDRFLDLNQTSFNRGLAVNLKAFIIHQVSELAQRYGLNLSDIKLTKLMQLVGGHPFLIQQALYHLARQDITLNQLLKTATTDAGIYRNLLHDHLRRLQADPQLSTIYTQVIQAPLPLEFNPLLGFQLQSMGLVALQGNLLIPSCELYQQYFSLYYNNR